MSRRRIGLYRIDQEIRRGAIGTMYQARDEKGDLRALKILHPFLIQDRVRLEQALKGLIQGLREHPSPYVVPIIDANYDQDWDGLYVVYPWIERAISLDALMQREGGRLSLDQVVRYLWRTLLALRAIQLAIGMHGALKLSNLILDGRGRFYVTDPGLAAAIYSTQSGWAPWELIGTSDYLAPELIQNRAAGFITDLYALAAMAYHLLAGRPPFIYEDPVRRRQAHREENPTPLSDVPEAFQRWLYQAMAKDPHQRFQAPESAIEALGNILLERGWAISFWLSEAYELHALGESGLAMEHLERILRVQPEHPEAQMLLERIRRSQSSEKETGEPVPKPVPEPPPSPPALMLRDRSGQIFRLRGEGVIGRRSASSPSPDVDLSSIDHGRYISRRHARVWFQDGTWWIEVFSETTNQTLLNGQPLDRGCPHPLPDRSRLRVGDVELEVRWITELE